MSATSWWAGSRAVLPAHFFALLLWHASAQDSAPAARSATVLEGRVLRADGTPVPQARILVARLRHDTLPPPMGSCLEDRSDPILEFVRTDADGRFRVAALAGVSYLLAAQSAEGMSAPLWPTLAGDPIELRLRPIRRITGTAWLVDPGVAPQPAAGARVTALLGLVASDRVLGNQPRCPVFVTAGRDGTFGLEVPQDLPITLHAELSGRVLTRLATNELGTGPVRIEMPPSRRILGTVRAASTGLPLPQTRVQCLSLNEQQVGTWTDSAGRFQFLPAFAPYRVVAFPGEQLAYGVGVGEADQPLEVLVDPPDLAITARLLRDDGRALGAARILLAGLVPKSGESPTYTEWPAQVGADGRVRIGCARGRFPLLGLVEVDGNWLQFLAVMPTASLDLGELRLGTAGRLTGNVFQASGAPAVHAAVILQPRRPPAFDGETDGSQLGRVLDRVVHTDHGGRFVAEHLQPGDYRVAAKTLADGYRVVEATVGPDSKPVRMTLPDTPMLAGRVVDAGGKPVPGARVQLGRKASAGYVSGTHHFVLATDAKGRFQLPGPAEESGTRWQVEVSATQDGQRSHAHQGDVPVRTLNLELVLVPDQAK